MVRGGGWWCRVVGGVGWVVVWGGWWCRVGGGVGWVVGVQSHFHVKPKPVELS